MPSAKLAWPLIAQVVLATLLTCAAHAQVLSRLPALALRPDAVTVSGLSSGAYMAGQFEVAYSASVSGAGIIAGGPYGCARGSLATGALDCSCPAEKTFASTLASAFGFGCQVFGETVYAQFAEDAISANRAGIDGTSNIAHHRVWLFSGGKDPVVAPALVSAARSFYARRQVPSSNLHFEQLPAAGHGLPSVTATLPCGQTATPFLIDCSGYDAAGALLRWLYPDLPTTPGTVAAGAFHLFSQTPYLPSGYTGLDASGWVYVPAACEQASAHCRLHVVFHGCEQGQSFPDRSTHPYGRQFVDGAGYNRWAEAGGVVVLYPQVRASPSGTPLLPYRYNPEGCWDFWGYTTDTEDTAPLHYAAREAPQMKAVKAMIDDLLRSP